MFKTRHSFHSCLTFNAVLLLIITKQGQKITEARWTYRPPTLKFPSPPACRCWVKWDQLRRRTWPKKRTVSIAIVELRTIHARHPFHPSFSPFATKTSFCPDLPDTANPPAVSVHGTPPLDPAWPHPCPARLLNRPLTLPCPCCVPRVVLPYFVVGLVCRTDATTTGRGTTSRASPPTHSNGHAPTKCASDGAINPRTGPFLVPTIYHGHQCKSLLSRVSVAGIDAGFECARSSWFHHVGQSHATTSPGSRW